MEKLRLGALLALFTLTCSPALGATVWRSPFGTAYAVAVNPTDGTVWAATGGSVMHLTAAGEIISQTNGFYDPRSLAVSPLDGSCWVCDSYLIPISPREADYGALVHLAADGAEIWRQDGLYYPSCVSMDPADGSCWVAEGGGLSRFAADGTLLVEQHGVGYPQAVAVDPTDSSVWITDTRYGQLFHLAADGRQLWVGEGLDSPWSVSVSPADGSCWVAELGHSAGSDWAGSAVSHYSTEGVLLRRVAVPPAASSIAADPWDDTVWVKTWGALLRLAADGTELSSWATHGAGWSGYDAEHPSAIAVSPVDGAVWLAVLPHEDIVRLDRDGFEQRFGSVLNNVECLAVDTSDGTLWAGDGDAPWPDLDLHVMAVRHFSPFGPTELWGGFPDLRVFMTAVNSSDGSCWAAIHGPPGQVPEIGQVVHLARTGEEVWRGIFRDVQDIAVNPADGSCWIADFDSETWNGAVTHLSAEGEVLWRGDGFTWPVSLAVNPSDGSCWVADQGAGFIALLGQDGAEVWRRSYPPTSREWVISLNSSDGSCWIAADDLVLYSAQGAELQRLSLDNMYFVCVEADPYDGSCWAGAEYQWGGRGVLFHVAPDGAIRDRLGGFPGFRGYGPIRHPIISVNTRDGSCWVADWRHGQVVHLNAGCAPFRDVPCDYWALAYILACYNAGLVSGYGDYTYRPEQVVTRGQMAVYVSRALAGGDAYVPTGPATATFSDVPTGYWAFKYVEYCHDQGVVGGYADGYRPEEIVNRAQMAVYVARAIAGGDAGVPPGPGTATFPDVPTTQWAFRYVEYCKAEGVVGGYPDGTYHPDEAVNRAQMAVYVARAFGLEM